MSVGRPSPSSAAALLGQALGEALRQDGIELVLGKRATGARREGDDYVLGFDHGPELRGDRLLVATGRRPRVAGIGLDTVGVTADLHRGIPVDEHLRAGERLWAIGDVNGIWPLTMSASTRATSSRRTSPARRVRRTTKPFPVPPTPIRRPRRWERPKRSTRRPRRCQKSRRPPPIPTPAESNGFLTLLSDGQRLTGAYALGPEAGEWLRQATLAIRAHVPVEVLSDMIQPFPSFSTIYNAALTALQMQIADMPPPTRPMAAQAASLSR